MGDREVAGCGQDPELSASACSLVTFLTILQP
jgi:hypothetical protein